MDLSDDVALLQIAVLQQYLLERDVEEATRRKHKRRPSRYQTRLWLVGGGGSCMDITPE